MKPVVSAFRRNVLALTALALLAPAPSSAHDIPASVVVHAFVRPQGQQLRVLVRAPLGAMRDVAFPIRGDGFLDLDRADQSLRDAATLWLARDIEIFEENTALPPPRIAAVR